MGCCFSNNRRKMSKPPVVAIIGATGYVGKFLMPTFLEAIKNGSLKELRVLSRSEKINSEEVKSFVKSGANVVKVSSYEDSSALADALQGVDVLVSALSMKGTDKVQTALLDALVTSKVKVYFPSEFGTNHYKVSYKHPVFDAKSTHFAAAKKKGLHPIRILNAGIMEHSFGKFGLDCTTGVWTIVGNGADIPCAMTAERDIARFTLEAVLLAHWDISKCPDELEVYSDVRTLREYSKAFDEVTGGKIKINNVPLHSFVEEYNKDKDFTKLVMIMFAEGAYDYSKATGNDLLNPKQCLWKLKKIEEYAIETNGIPK